MKTLYSIIIISLITSCNSLDLSPLSEGSSGNWYSDETQVEMAVSFLFSGGRFFEQEIFRGVFTGINTDNWTRRLEVTEVTGGTMTSQSTDARIRWEDAYTCISAANRILLNLDKASGNVPEEKLNIYEANARFARASKYAELIFLFGDVPYYEEILSIEEAFEAGRTSKDVILESIYEDYDYGIEHLPLEYGTSENKYATKGAALAMKARAALYMHDYTTAKDAAKACIDLDTYELVEDYADIYKIKNSKEAIFNFPRSTSLDNQLEGGILKDCVSRTSGGFASRGPSWDLLCSYLCSDGLPIDESPLFNPREPFKNRDPRLGETIVPFNSEWLGFIFTPHPDTLTVLDVNTGQRVDNLDNRAVQQWSSFNGLVWKKKVNGDWLVTGAEHDNIIIRYADVLLMYAEAKIELNEIDQSVLDAMNRVRARAYGADISDTGNYPVITQMDQAELRKILRMERRMELAFEGLRYPDLIRWKLAEVALNRAQYGLLDPEELREKVVDKGFWFFGETPEIDEYGLPDLSNLYDKGVVKQLVQRRFNPERQYLWPIPSEEIIINSNLNQNPNY